ncbi:PAAR domain-containing protein [Sphingomonas sp. S2-65]|uniref:PAAR domain-containing protein n=1 Tax=Sphingomonas sp. S2-65 TaxID=2903960 RepID=UPI001F188C94|nr:PAAR domain-containing protein [Sphingomonas sp. S2-65]UYY57227.1 PAAR domain-containing protein [Sphingomonas sp. S2-65]
MPPAARTTDTEACPVKNKGTIVTGEKTVLIMGLPAARKGDTLDCGSPSQIESGCPTVKIGNNEAARIGDTTCHGGKIATGAPTVLIGDGASARRTTLDAAHRNAAPFVTE